MPPIPGPKKRAAAPKDGTDGLNSEARGRVGTESPSEGGNVRASDSPPSRSPSDGGKRTPKNRQLQVKIERLYMVAGTVILPFRRFYPPMESISGGMKEFSQEAAEAWVDLAEDDPRVRKWLESFTSASTWGNVIGIHIAIFAAAIPGPAANLASGMIPQDQDPIAFARAMGLSDADIDMAMRMAGMDKGGPGDTVRTNAKPEPSIQQVQAQEGFNASAGMATPGQMGVQNSGDEFNGPQVTGGLP